MTYRLWVNEKRTIFVRFWDSGETELSTRNDPSETWGPPVKLYEEKLGKRV